ncbi:8006_t:CDS:10 [Funneliformis caledonium]|uniref:8006_t:CDS:1 n=1 Tax=Funneliformis caledonium TaxID=1117310 RepID=A0A9N9GBY1_9GLOM|nr:8006_t:CDS:10 [Funneliformis caledonium]
METLFHNLPPSEDQVYYSIYFPFPSTSDHESFLQETSALIISELSQYLNGYIWQKDSFQLKIIKSESDPGYPFLHGKTRFGDCIDDEWFIVFLLRQISLKFKDAVISVSDYDGEFLLIEAAKQLPSWLDPSNSQNRNELHIIPLPRTPAEMLSIPTGKLSIEKAVEMIRNDNVNTKADINVQLVAFGKSDEFPQKIQQNIHHARCHIPRKIAHVLHQNPQLLASAVEAFYTRDPIALKACQRMENFPPSTSITVSVKFTKTLYAQMLSQRFYPPKPFKLPAGTSEKYKSAELGMKVACGFEILCTDKYYTKLATRSSDMIAETYPFNEDPDWKLFRDKLVKRNYYRGEVEGSKKYKQLDQIAKQQYIETLDDETKYKTTPFEQINQLLRSPMIPDEVLTAITIEDDDSWMNIDPKQLEELLNERERSYAEINKETKEFMDGQKNSVDLTNMIDAFEKFVDFEGAGFEGAEFLEYENEVHLDPTKFLNIMRQTLGISEEEYRKLTNEKVKQEHQEAAETNKVPVIIQENQSDTHTAPISNEEMDIDMNTYMQAMEAELSTSKIPESFVHSSNEDEGSVSSSKKGDEESNEEFYKPVDVDLNLVKNLLESFKSQEGLPGPFGNIINRLGNVLPKDEDDDNISEQ